MDGFSQKISIFKMRVNETERSTFSLEQSFLLEIIGFFQDYIISYFLFIFLIFSNY